MNVNSYPHSEYKLFLWSNSTIGGWCYRKCKYISNYFKQFLAICRWTAPNHISAYAPFYEIVPDGVTLAHKFFEYVSSSRRQEILPRLYNGSAKIFLVNRNGKPKCAFIACLNNQTVHLQEIGGNFLFEMERISEFLEITAVLSRKKRVTFCARNETIKKIGERLGYKKFYSDCGLDEFEKVI